MTWNNIRSALAVILAAASAAASPEGAFAQSDPILIRAGTIHTVTNGTIRDGEILVRDGVIEAGGDVGGRAC